MPAPRSETSLANDPDSFRNVDKRPGPIAEDLRIEDPELVAGICRRDAQSFSVLYDRYSRLVYSVALRVTANPMIAEDILHDVFLQLWNSPTQFDSARGNLATWIGVIARNRAIDSVRREKLKIDSETRSLDWLPNHSSNTDHKDLVQRVRHLLTEMPDGQRNAIQMAFFDGLSHAEIAARTSEPLGTIKSRIRSGLLAIRKAFEL